MFTAKSVILDISSNWGSSFYYGLRSMEFKSGGTLVSVATADITAYGGTSYAGYYEPENAFDTSLSKTGSASNKSWNNDSGTQRVICVFDTAIDFDEIVINNYHSSGSDTTEGIKGVKITTSPSAITDTTYNAAIADGYVLWEGEFPQHAATDTVQDYTLTDLNEPPVYLPALSSSGVVLFPPTMIQSLPCLQLNTDNAQGSLDADLSDLGITGRFKTGTSADLLLPDLGIEISAGERGDADNKLSPLSLEAFSGAIAESDLPYMEIAATGKVEVVGRMEGTISVPSITANTGSRVDGLRFPGIKIEANIDVPFSCSLKKYIPGLTAVASISGGSGTVNVGFPFVKLVSEGHHSGTGTLSKTLPGLKIDADSALVVVGVLDGNLSDLRVDGQSNSANMNLDSSLPPVVSGIASGSDSGSNDSTITNHSRFTGALLRYQRWN